MNDRAQEQSESKTIVRPELDDRNRLGFTQMPTLMRAERRGNLDDEKVGVRDGKSDCA